MKKPIFFSQCSDLPKNTAIIDAVRSAEGEYFYITHPNIPKNHPDAKKLIKRSSKDHPIAGLWVYYPWKNTAIHLPEEQVFYQLRTARNRNLISTEEQAAFRDIAVGIAGLSVGSAVALSLVRTGGPKILKISDPDTIEVTNLNRMQANLLDIGNNKAEAIARSIWEIDPFAKLDIWSKGINTANISDFLNKKTKLDVVVDEMDDIQMKIQLRFECRKARIPVVMATDNGDSVIVDVERFDLEPTRPIFHGRVHILPGQVKHIDRKAFIELSSQIIDPNLFTTRQQRSILAIGTELSGVAQLGTAANIAGATIAYVIREIACRRELKSGRYILGCEQIFSPSYNSKKEIEKRRIETENFKSKLGLK